MPPLKGVVAREDALHAQESRPNPTIDSRRWAAALLLVVTSGCTTFRGPPPPAPASGIRRVEVSGAGIPMPAEVVTVSTGRPKHVLAISGGGMYGAFPAGFLKGWTEAGDRPTFDVVTGISTGSLIAPFAFLGAEYDGLLEREYTQTHRRDIYRPRIVLAPLLSDSIADPTPLRRRIADQITPEILARIALAHQQGRRLYVGTTNLDARQLVVWDIGAIATGNDPERLELVRKVLLASCAVPGFFPPVAMDVEIDGRHYTELHGDGGVTASLFLQPEMLGPAEGAGVIRDAGEGAEVRVLVSGKLDAPTGAVRRSFLSVSTDALRGVLQAQQDGDLMQVYSLAKSLKADFGVAAVPNDLPVSGSAVDFDPKPMGILFAAGRQLARSSTPWLASPPGYGPGQQTFPRSGTRFHDVTTVPSLDRPAPDPALRRATHVRMPLAETSRSSEGWPD